MLISQDTPCFEEILQMCKILPYYYLCQKNISDEIIQNLHVADNSTLDPNDKLRKVSQLIEKINEQYKQLALMNLWFHVLESMGLNDLRETSQSSLDIRFGLLLLH